jgi:hypothetical protein
MPFPSRSLDSTLKGLNMDSGMRSGHVVGLFLLVVVVFLGLGWLATGNDFFLYKAFAPKYEQVRYDVFKESQAYNDGMAQQLQSFWIDYTNPNTSPEHKQALASTILHRFADYDDSKLSPDLGNFLRQLRREHTSLAR